MDRVFTEHEKLITIHREYKHSLEYAATVYNNSQSMQFSKDTPRKAIEAEGYILSLKVKHEVLLQVLADGNMDEEEYRDRLRGSKIILKKVRSLLAKVKEDYDDFDEAMDSFRSLTNDLEDAGLIKKKKKKESES